MGYDPVGGGLFNQKERSFEKPFPPARRGGGKLL